MLSRRERTLQSDLERESWWTSRSAPPIVHPHRVGDGMPQKPNRCRGSAALCFDVVNSPGKPAGQHRQPLARTRPRESV